MDSITTVIPTTLRENTTILTTVSPTELSLELRIWRELFFWMPPICFVLGIIGNSLCLASLCVSRALLPSPTRIYMTLILLSADVILTSSAVRWLCTSFVDYLASVTDLSFLRDNLLTDTGCQLMDYFRSGALFVLVWLMVAMTGERYVTLARPFTVYRRSGRISVIVSTVVVLLGYGAAVTRFFAVVVADDVTNPGGRIIATSGCGLNDLGVIILLVDVLVIYLLPPVFLAVLAVCLSCMLCEYARYRKRRRRPPGSGSPGSRGKPEAALRHPHAQLAVTMAFVYAVGLIPLFAWAVLTLVSVIWGEDPVADRAAHVTRNISELLILLLTALNLLYFLIAGGRFRSILGGLLCGCMCSAKEGSNSSDDDGSTRTESQMSNGNNSRARSPGQINLAFDDHNQSEMTQL